VDIALISVHLFPSCFGLSEFIDESMV